MRPAFLPRLINGPFDDPGLYVPFQFARRAILFDLGDLTALSAREILKLTHIFVSHTHMDHFVGFDRLLRLHLGRSRKLHLYGPEGFFKNIAGKLAGYTWNLVGEDSCPLVLQVNELRAAECATARFRCSRKFSPARSESVRPFDGTLLSEPGYSVTAAVLDHGIPCLAFALEERFHINILKDGLTALGLAPGPWLAEFKQQLYAGAASHTPVTATRTDGPERRFPIGELADRIARISPGQKFAYVTDAADTAANREKIIALAGGCDRLFIEAAFAEADRHAARAKLHLTARGAGELAAAAGAKRLTIFHFSPRYVHAADRLYAEADAAFHGAGPSDTPAR